MDIPELFSFGFFPPDRGAGEGLGTLLAGDVLTRPVPSCTPNVLMVSHDLVNPDYTQLDEFPKFRAGIDSPLP